MLRAKYTTVKNVISVYAKIATKNQQHQSGLLRDINKNYTAIGVDSELKV